MTDDTPAGERYSMRWVGRQLTRLEANLRKLDRQLEQHFANGATTLDEDLWAIQMLTKLLDVEEKLHYWQDVRDGLTGGVDAYNSDTIRRGDYVRISGRWRKVARVNQQSVTVETDHSWTGRAPYYDITGHRPADHLSP
jgi:hypothetical protein